MRKDKNREKARNKTKYTSGKKEPKSSETECQQNWKKVSVCGIWVIRHTRFISLIFFPFRHGAQIKLSLGSSVTLSLHTTHHTTSENSGRIVALYFDGIVLCAVCAFLVSFFLHCCGAKIKLTAILLEFTPSDAIQLDLNSGAAIQFVRYSNDETIDRARFISTVVHSIRI